MHTAYLIGMPVWVLRVAADRELDEHDAQVRFYRSTLYANRDENREPSQVNHH